MSALPSEYHGSITQSWPKATLMPCCAHLRHAGLAAALGIGVVAALQDDVDQRIGDGVNAGFGHQRQELRDIVVVHRMHRGEMRAGDAAGEAEALRLGGQRLDMARERVVGLVAMHVDHQPALRGDLAERGDAGGAVGHGALEMRDAADDVDAEVERAVEVLRRGRRAVVAVLRKGDELQVDIGRDRRFTSSRASTASRRSSQTSTWLRMASRPCATARSQ